METVVILHDIRSAHNVGSIFRTADGAGVTRVFLTGHTPRPIDRFGRAQPEIAKTALGAEQTVPWEPVDDVSDLVHRLRASGYMIVAVEQAPNSIDLADFHPTDRVAYLFGSETAGLPPALVATADVVVELPMRGEKESLNVSVAAGIILYNDLS